MIRILDYDKVGSEGIISRTELRTDVEDTVRDIIADVRKNGDEALFGYTEKFDKVKLDKLEVSREEIDEAVGKVEPEFLRILEQAAANIRKFHSRQVRNGFIINDEHGIVTGQKIIPVDRAGLYVPGGTAAYPSTVLMDSIPAKLAGVPELIMTTPPGFPDKISSLPLFATTKTGFRRIFCRFRNCSDLAERPDSRLFTRR